MGTPRAYIIINRTGGKLLYKLLGKLLSIFDSGLVLTGFVFPKLQFIVHKTRNMPV